MAAAVAVDTPDSTETGAVVLRRTSSLGSRASCRSNMSRKSSMRVPVSGNRMLRKKKRVRFQGIHSPYTASLVSFLVLTFRSGSLMTSYWEFTIACGAVIDLIFIPLSMLGQMFHHHEPEWRANYDEDIAAHLSSKFLVFKDFEVWMDVLFVVDLFYRLARALVRDLGYDDSPVDRLVNAVPTDTPEHEVSKHIASNLALDSGNKEGALHVSLRVGKAVRWQLVQCCMRLVLMSLEWIVLLTKASKRPVSIDVTMLSALARLYRLSDLWSYFTASQEDIAQDVRWVAFFKFAFIIFTTVRSP